MRTHDKFLTAGPAAAWLWLCGIGYCQDGLTDGFIPASAIDFLGVKRPLPLVQRLVEVRLWDAVDGGWRVHDYLEHNKSGDEVRTTMRKRREGGHLGGRPRTSEETLEVNHPKNPIRPSVLPSDPSDLPADVGAEPQSASGPSSPAVLTFPTVGSLSTWDLTEAHQAELSESYPNIDVPAQARRAHAWIRANVARRKTARGMAAFLVNWLNRAVSKGETVTPQKALSVVGVDDGWFSECVRLHGNSCGGRSKHQGRMERDAIKARA